MVRTIDQLQDGECKVLAVAHGKSKVFKGYFDSKKQTVFFIIPHYYTVKGYIQ